MQNVWLATVPNNDESSEKTFADISGGLSANMSKCYRFEIPKLTVGTLDSLMSLSDDLVKINMQVEV